MNYDIGFFIVDRCKFITKRNVNKDSIIDIISSTSRFFVKVLDENGDIKWSPARIQGGRFKSDPIEVKVEFGYPHNSGPLPDPPDNDSARCLNILTRDKSLNPNREFPNIHIDNGKLITSLKGGGA